MAGSRFRYSRWDGTQVGFELDAHDIMGEIADDLMYHGDPNAALRRLMQEGFTDRNGERIQGLRELMEQLRQERAERLENHSLGGVYDEIAEQLADVIDTERQALGDRRTLADMQRSDPDASADAMRNAELADTTATEKEMALDLLPENHPDIEPSSLFLQITALREAEPAAA